MTLIIFFSLLIFSGVLSSLSKLYLSKDLELVHSMPVSREKLFLSRWVECMVDSSWMVLVYGLPVFLCYGIVYRAGGFYYAMAAMGLLPFCMIASSASALIVMMVALFLPAGRLRSAVFLLSFLLFLIPCFPKDALCYILGLTPMHLGIFLLVSTIGRIPGTLMATLQGAKAFDQQYASVMVLLGISTLVILIFYIYREEIHRLIKKLRFGQ